MHSDKRCLFFVCMSVILLITKDLQTRCFHRWETICYAIIFILPFQNTKHFNHIARVNGLLSWAQHKTELLQKGLLCCTWDLSDSSRCFWGGSGGQCPCSTIWGTVCLWGQGAGSAAAVVAIFSGWAGSSAEGSWLPMVCRFAGWRVAVQLYCCGQCRYPYGPWVALMRMLWGHWLSICTKHCPN